MTRNIIVKPFVKIPHCILLGYIAGCYAK